MVLQFNQKNERKSKIMIPGTKRCAKITLKGTQCRFYATDDSNFCRIHLQDIVLAIDDTGSDEPYVQTSNDITNLVHELGLMRKMVLSQVNTFMSRTENTDKDHVPMSPEELTTLLNQVFKYASMVKIQVDNINNTAITKVELARFKMSLESLIKKYVPPERHRMFLDDLTRALVDVESSVEYQ